MVFTNQYELDEMFYVDVHVSCYDDYERCAEKDKTIVYKIGDTEFTRSDIQKTVKDTGYFEIGPEKFVENYYERRDRDGDLKIEMSGYVDYYNQYKGDEVISQVSENDTSLNDNDTPWNDNDYEEIQNDDEEI
jgi:hypothetical protein